jgi:hypothetical protein
MHVERFGNDIVQGIELGACYIFPKLDGTNGSLWFEYSCIKAGSRNRELSLIQDNAGFYNSIVDNPKEYKKYEKFFKIFPDCILYGEWLVPHSLKTYKQDAWRKFYVFDVYDTSLNRYIHYDAYQKILESLNINYIPPICIINNASYDNLLHEIQNNKFLIEDGNGIGEGIVIKNYNYKNKNNHTIWAKIVTNEFKEKHSRTMGAPIKDGKKMVEQDIINKYITQHFVDKTFAKIVNENEVWNSKYIPRLFSTIYHDLINEEIWDIVKKMKQPTINFKTLHILMVQEIKRLKPEIF